MQIITIAKQVADSGFVTPYVSNLGIKAYDVDNLYPQNIQKIVGASSTGSSCLSRFVSFIEGNGLKSQALSDFICNRAGNTVDDLHHLCSGDLGEFGGCYIHVNYNVLGEITEAYHIPYENCRLEEEDDHGYVAHIVVSPDWSGRKTRSGRIIRPSKNTVDYIDVFNPDPEVVRMQIERAGGIEHYKGQVLYVSNQGVNSYSVPIFHAVLTEMSTDDAMGVVRNRNARNNFMPAGMLVVHDSQYAPGNKEQEDISDKYVNDIKNLQGASNLGKIAVAVVNTKDDNPEFIPFKGENYDAAFINTDTSVVERIYAAFNQDVFYCIRIGKLGFSGDLVRDAEDYYARFVTKEQRMLTRAYKKLFSHWLPGRLPNWTDEDIQIEPLVQSVDKPLTV